jgi:high affinity Mn2+ porin
VARLFFRQVVGLGGGAINVGSDLNQLAGTRDRDALVFTVGRYGVPDQFDKNPVSNDPHTSFMSWGLWASAAYDYPADTRGWTWGATAELFVDWWAVRAGIFLLPKEANQLDLEWDVSKARGLVAEAEAHFALLGRPAAARVLVFHNTARMGSYAQALQSSGPPDIIATRADGRTKAGVAVSANAELAPGLQSFVRASYNDGANESWAFTEIDRSLALGATLRGAPWSRPDDEMGAAMVVSGLSSLHRAYLAAGGYGFIIGDGALSYAPEILGEVYYRAQLLKELAVGVNYQPILHPAYNRDRGPVHVFTGRVHVGF